MEKDVPPNARLGEAIRAAREASGLSLREVAERSGISKAMLSYMERGAVMTPDPRKLATLADVLGVDASELMEPAGYGRTANLPTFTPYLRTKYKDLPPAARDELNASFQRIAAKYGYDPDGPPPGADE